MEENESTQCTQGVVDPRRMGRNNSGLSAEDVADVMCILHPTTIAAFKLVAETAARAPEHILQNANLGRHDSDVTPSMVEEQETFVLNDNASNQALDLALRFSTRTIQPALGFVFGRNADLCDIAVNGDVHKRVSNLHFAVYMNDSGVLMLKDMSTNGTMVDDVLLKGKSDHHPKSRMLSHGSIIAIISYNNDEILKFIVRLPSRDGFQAQYEAQYRRYMARQSADEMRYRQRKGDELLLNPRLAPAHPRQQHTSVKAPMIQNQYGMHWSGGDKYNVVGQIGKGAFASVYQLATKRDGQLFAAKELEKRKFIKNGILDRKLENEMQIMQSISHPSIVQYCEHEDIQNHLYIIMEFVACGDLQQHLTEYGPLSESMAKQMATQVFDALHYLHNKRITHRDIKPDNILIASLDDDNFVIKLSDFGLSKAVKDNDTFLKTFCGTLLYCAPEVFPHYDAHVAGQGTKRPRKQMPPANRFHSYSQAVDIWSFGAVLWYSLCHKPPFEGVADNTGRGMFDKIMMTPLDAADLTRQGTSEEAVALLVQMLNTDPAARPSALYCMQHEWFGPHKASALRRAASPRQAGLGMIAEVSEAELGAREEYDVAALNSQYSEVSLNESDYSFFDPRQSKRFKTNDMDYREQHGDVMESSVEQCQAIPIILEESEQEQEPSLSEDAAKSKPPKLFGEISHSDLPAMRQNNIGEEAAPNQLKEREGRHLSQGSPRSGQIDSLKPLEASPSLLGAESLVRDLNMDSPYPNSSNGDGSDLGSRSEPTSPKTPGSVGEHPSQEMPAVLPDNTPKPPAPVPFRRRINLPLPPSFWWDPNDPSTHTVEYASKASGHDFSAEPLYIPKSTSIPTTISRRSEAGSESAAGVDVQKETSYPELLAISGTSSKQQSANARALPSTRPRFGRLVPTDDSFSQTVIELNAARTSWGRSPENTVVFPNRNDTRVPKLGLWVFFHAPGIEKVPEGADFTHLPGLYCGIRTHASRGVRINGVQLTEGEHGKGNYGRLHTGDRIEVWAGSRDGSPGLTFAAEIFYGEGVAPRPADAPKFKVIRKAGNSSATASVDEETGGRTA
uniref:non-specific serine/threonine protein kinase n=1 Tax=Ramularia collo-cygni TaxID=112498 RepID=A0A2D3UTK2_9PEZI